MKYVAYSLLVLALTTSCEKESDSNVSLEGNYKTDTALAPGAVRVYTAAGQLTNPQLVDAFIRRNRANSFFISSTVTSNNGTRNILSFNDKLVKISFLKADNSVAFISDYTITNSNSNSLTLAEKDSSFTSFRSADQNCDALSEKIKGAPATYGNCRMVSVSGGTLNSCGFLSTRAIRLENGQPSVPLYNWFVKTSRPNSSCGIGLQGEWNTFNPESTKLMVAGDTVAIQESKINLIKQ